MRYTTIIDISEFPIVYRNLNCRLLYLHLCLRSGFHDTDRDLYNCPIRSLAQEIGITVSACRHAVDVLIKHGLLTYSGGVFRVKKFIMSDTITKRATSKKQERVRRIAEDRESKELARAMEEQERERATDELREKGKTPFMVFYEGLLLRARNGDADALAGVKKYKATYDAHKAEIDNEKMIGKR